MEKITWLVGLKTKDGKKISEEVAIQKIQEILEAFGIQGYSIIQQVGFWKGEQEDSIRIETLNTWGIKTETIRKIGELIRDTLEQESVGIEVTKSNFDFV